MTEKLQKKDIPKDGNQKNPKKDYMKNIGKDLKDTEEHYENSKEFSETYYNKEKLAEYTKIASFFKKQGYFESSGNSKDNNEGDSEGGGGNGKLFGLSDYKGPDSTKTGNPWSGSGPFVSGVRSKLKNCDRYDSEILNASKKEKVDPMLTKIMMLMESGGNPGVGYSSDGAGSIGIMQLTPGNYGDRPMDPKRLATDVEYSCEIAAAGYHGKASVAKGRGEPTSVKNVAKYYNGDGRNAVMYSEAFSEIYEGFPGLKSSNDYRNMQGVKKESSGKGGQKDSGKYIKPMDNYTITSEFGTRADNHLGTDLAAPTGTPIKASREGVVVSSANGLPHWSYGECVVLKHNDGLHTLYGHMSQRKCSVGDKVKQGQVIGLCGSTGNSSGPHLHFEFQEGGENGTRVNARKYVNL